MSRIGFAGARAWRTVPRMAPPAAHRTDRRVDRTRAALMRAFVDLMFSQDLETITVAGIVERANVGRSTFYTHFRGRQDILKASLEFPSLPLARAATEDVGAESLLGLLAHFRQQRRLARAFTGGAMRQLWVHRLAELIEPHLMALARRAQARPLLPPSLAALAIAELQIGMVVHWLASHAPPSPEATAGALIAASRGAVTALLGGPPR
jgi:AcrR family transcriptional regulator